MISANVFLITPCLLIMSFSMQAPHHSSGSVYELLYTGSWSIQACAVQMCTCPQQDKEDFQVGWISIMVHFADPC